MKRLALCLAVLAFSCTNIPNPFPTPQPGEPFDCLQGTEAKGLLQVRNPILGRYIVRFKDSKVTASSRVDILGIARALGVQDKDIRVFQLVLGFAAEMSPEVAKAISKDSRVLFVEQDGVKKVNAASWGLPRIVNRDRVLDGPFEPGTTGKGATVAVIDTGVNANDDFDDRYVACVYSISENCNDGHGHGTHVAGTVAGRYYGVAKEAKLIAAKVLDDSGSGSDSGVIAGIDAVVEYAETSGELPVINMSLGGSASVSLNEAVCRAWKAGVVVAVAAGNEYGEACSGSPAQVKQAITTGAIDKDDNRADFSNSGECVNIWAPGVDIVSIGGQMSGTSMASPHVCGGAALVRGKYPKLTPDEVMVKLNEFSTKDKLGGVAGSPNELLYVKGF
jgi:subtilisin family serine protease